MTAWQSMFAAGACTVSVLTGPEPRTERWSGTLSLGNSSPTFDDGQEGGVTLQVIVDDAGVMTLLNLGSDAPLGYGYELRVTPQYDVSAKALQADALLFGGDGWGTPTGTADVANGNALTTVDVDADSGVCTPSFVAFDATSDAYLSGIAGFFT